MICPNEHDLRLWRDMGFITEAEYQRRVKKLVDFEKKKEDEEAYDRAMQGVS